VPRAYKEDLAYIHDVGHREFAQRAAPALLRIFRKRGIHKGRVVDLGCGSGILARELLRAGHDVLGTDISKAMIAIARKQAPRAQFQEGSFLTVDLPACDAVTAIGEVFNYLFDEANRTTSLKGFFRRVHAALRPGGVFVFDVIESNCVRSSGERFIEGKDWAIFLKCREHQGIVTRNITSFRKVGKLYRRDRELHRLRLFNRAETVRQLRAAGFRVTIRRGYGTFRFARGHIAFVAERK
jgi:SAM-dependent methyltransferase